MNTPINLLAKKFQATLSTAEEQELDSWINESEENRSIFSQAQAMWTELGFGSAAFTPDRQVAWEMMAASIKPAGEPQRKLLAKQIGKTAVIILALFLAMGLLATLATFNANTAITASKRGQTELLPDGTTAILDSGSTIRYGKGFGNRSRTVNLNGEAIFESRAMDKLPLTVRTPQGKLISNGSSLAVFWDGSRYEAMLLSGTAQLKMLGKTVELQPQQMVVIDSTGIPSVIPADYNLLAWKSGIIAADSMPLGKLVRPIEKLTGKRLSIQAKVSYAQPITFRLQHPTPQAIADTLAAQLGLRAKVDGNVLVIY